MSSHSEEYSFEPSHVEYIHVQNCSSTSPSSAAVGTRARSTWLFVGHILHSLVRIMDAYSLLLIVGDLYIDLEICDFRFGADVEGETCR